MKRDLDRLMAERYLDAAVVMGSTFDSPTVYYLTGGAKFEGATIVLRPGQRPVLVHSPMELDEAPRTGMETALSTRWDIAEIVRRRTATCWQPRPSSCAASWPTTACAAGWASTATARSARRMRC